MVPNPGARAAYVHNVVVVFVLPPNQQATEYTD